MRFGLNKQKRKKLKEKRESKIIKKMIENSKKLKDLLIEDRFVFMGLEFGEKEEIRERYKAKGIDIEFID